MQKTQTHSEYIDGLQGLFRNLSGSTMPSWLAENMSKKVAAVAGLNDKKDEARFQNAIRQSRFFTDALVATILYSDPHLHRRTFATADNQLGESAPSYTSSISPAAQIYDALELARCMAQMGQQYPGMRSNIFTTIKADHALQSKNPNLTAGNKRALDILLYASNRFLNDGEQRTDRGEQFDDLNGMLASQSRFSQLAQTFAVAEAAQLATMAPKENAPINPLIAAHNAKKDSHDLFDYFRRLYSERAPLSEVFAPPPEPQSIVNPSIPVPQNSSISDSAIRKLFKGRTETFGNYSLIDIPPEDQGEQQGANSKQRTLHLARFMEPAQLLISHETGVLNGAQIFDVAAQERLRQLIDGYRNQLDEIEKKSGGMRSLRRQLNQIQLAEREALSRKASEDGLINPARLTQVIIDPTSTEIYLSKLLEKYKDCTVTLLVDNSGSMMGSANRTATACVDRLAQDLHKAGIPNEVIGFTSESTRDKDMPETLKQKLAKHGIAASAKLILYKDYRDSWSKARRNISISLAESFFSGTPEGLALQFSWRRILLRPEQKKIILVIGDGAANDRELLAQTVTSIEKERKIHLASIKIGRDPSSNYSNSVVIGGPDELYTAMVDQLLTELASPLPQSRPRNRVRQAKELAA